MTVWSGTQKPRAAGWLISILLGLVACGPDPRVSLDEGEVLIEYVGHATFRLHDEDGERIVIDPFGSRQWISYGYPSRDELGADASFVSHPHYDHDGGVSVGLDYPYSRPPATSPGTYRRGRFRVTGLAGRHAKDYGADFDHRNTVWRVDVGELTIVHWGDNDADISTLGDELKDVDVLLLPVDGYQHLLTMEEVEAIRVELRPRVLVPMHYRLVDIERNDANTLTLGGIEPWLEGTDGSGHPETGCEWTVAGTCEPPVWPPQTGVVRLGSHRQVVSSDRLPVRDEIWVFEPSPMLRE